ncbi:MAG: ferritin [Candidatus Promineifilaceae bacterium]|nr:ferritin [Candidatus Promineifilaceae bacterium]
MALKSPMIQPFNDQIQSEFTASLQYVAIAAYFDDLSLVELANFFYRQAEEERMHAMKFVHFMLETEVRPTIPAVPELRNAFDSPADAVDFALQQERTVTEQIDNLVSLALENGDHAANNFLQWFVDEQVEEVDTMSTLLQTVRLAGDNLLLVEDYVRRNPQHAGEDLSQ